MGLRSFLVVSSPAVQQTCSVLTAGCVLQDPAVWSSLTGLNSDSNKNFRPGVPRKSVVRGDSSRETDRAVEMR